MADTPDGSYREASAPIYEDLQRTEEFQRLRSRYRGFVIPWTVAFLVWYLTYVALSNWAPGFMNTQVVGNINVALVFGLLQFVTTFGIAWLYAVYSQRNFDPLASELNDRFDRAAASAAGPDALRKEDDR